jgi:hypothetical protein
MAFFVDANYQLDSGTIVRMKVDRADINAANPVVAGAALVRVDNKRSTRSPGLAVRQFKLRRQIVAEDVAQGIPSVYRYRFMTVLSEAAYVAANEGDVIQHGGGQYVLYKKLPEINKI